MTRKELDDLLNNYNMKVDGKHQGAGKFADLEIGVGASVETLLHVRKRLIELGQDFVEIRHINNPGHEQYGKPYLEVGSFWNE